MHGALRLLVNLTVVLVLTVVIRDYVLEPFRIPSASMEPTLHGCPGCRDDRIVVFRLAYRLHSVHRGDVVVFSRPPGVPDNEKFLVKRVVGLAGQEVQARDGRVSIDGRPIDDPHVNPACAGTRDFGPVTVAAGRLFVMGDNRCDSFDSRRFGTIPTSSVVGHALARVWPITRLGSL